MQQAIEEARADFEQTTDQLLQNFAKIPEDKVAWSPAPTARTPVQIVAHCAESVGHLTEMMKGSPFQPSTTAEAERAFRENEKAFITRESALKAYQAKSRAFLGFLENVKAEDLDRPVTLPFGMGEAPLRLMITMPAVHTRSHVPQLEYIQTILGDRTWLI